MNATSNAAETVFDISKYNLAQIVRIFNLPSATSNEDLEEPCSRYGRVVTTHIAKGLSSQFVGSRIIGNIGSVVMENASEAAAVVKGLQGALFADHEITVMTLSIVDLLLGSRQLSLSHRPAAEDLEQINASTTAGKPLTTFTCFRDLPAEIRVIIWKEAQSLGRTVQLEWRLKPYLSTYMAMYKNRTPIPSHLHVCHESREEALKVYDLTFSCRDETGDISPRTYFDFSKDELYISISEPTQPVNFLQHSSELLGLKGCFSARDASKIQSLILCGVWADDWLSDSTMKWLSTHMTSIERVRLLFHHPSSATTTKCRPQGDINHIDFRPIFPVRGGGDLDGWKKAPWEICKKFRNCLEYHFEEKRRNAGLRKIRIAPRKVDVEWSAVVVS